MFQNFVTCVTSDFTDCFIDMIDEEYFKISFLGYSSQTYPLKYLSNSTDKNTASNP